MNSKTKGTMWKSIKTMLETGDKSDPAFCLGSSIEKTNSGVRVNLIWHIYLVRMALRIVLLLITIIICKKTQPDVSVSIVLNEWRRTSVPPSKVNALNLKSLIIYNFLWKCEFKLYNKLDSFWQFETFCSRIVSKSYVILTNFMMC